MATRPQEFDDAWSGRGAPNVRTIGDDIERLLDDLQARLDPPAFDRAVELMQLVTELYGAGLARVVQLAEATFDDEAAQFVRRLAADDLVASLLVVHGLHPDGVAQRVAAALESVRPFLAGHGGDVELVAIDEEVGAVQLRLLGSCDGCPSSALTLRSTVERAIVEAAPEITIIDVVDDLDGSGGGVPDPLRTPVVMSRKPEVAFDPATGCGAAR